MLKCHNYPVPEAFLNGPLYPELDSDRVSNVVPVAPACTPAPDPTPIDLTALFPVEEPDVSGIPTIRLPSSPLPSGCSTPLLDEQPAPSPQTSVAEVGTFPVQPLETAVAPAPSDVSTPEGSAFGFVTDEWVGNFTQPGPVEDTTIHPIPMVSSAGSENTGFTSGVASSTASLPQAIVAPQPAPAAEVSDPETQRAVASILPVVDFAPLTTSPNATFLDGSAESPAAQVGEGDGVPREWIAEVYNPPVEPNSVPSTEDDVFDPNVFFHGAPSQWDDSPTGRLLQEARQQAMLGIRSDQVGYRVEFSARHCIQVTKNEFWRQPSGGEYQLVTTWVVPQ